MEDEKRASTSVIAPAARSHRPEKHTASKTARVNPLPVILVTGSGVQVEGSVPQGTSSAQVTVVNVTSAGIPFPTRSKGVVVPAVEEDDPNI